MDDLRIEYDAPNDVYFPGQAVTGKVIIQNREWIKARFLKICIHGGAHTHWSESRSTYRTNTRGERERFTENVNYNATINYLTGESIAWQSRDGTDRLPAGTNVFPFAFNLPINCAPSFEGCHGHIRYDVHVELDRPWKFNKKSRKCFSVIPVFDLNITPTAINPMVNTASKNTGLILKKGLVTITVNLPKRGYVAGEIMPITVNIDNGSKVAVSEVSAKMTQLSHFHASHGNMIGVTAHTHNRNDEKLVAESRRVADVPAKSRGQMVLSMKIPAIVPSFNCPIIAVDYCLTVKVSTQQIFGGGLKCEFPLIIGTIPIRQMNQAAPGAMPTMPSVSAPPYPVVAGASASQAVYPTAPSAPPASPGGEAPPSYEESVHGAGKVEDAEAFAPRYPVYNNLPQQQNSQLPPEYAPPLPAKSGF
ncbi:Arrestin C-terminal-like domain-containing protein [Caenorhabditis elegans]|uniref:Arrestin C-terminal-like domain-containing protein n=1 Tax=Caenorhabditis elegans TaxID=6239 RepID=Q9XXI4_CAEEL|nr:Arrestin C-terminal-like domain-containing protein [Caenorhabditis elegans]CAA19457.2 Arrestin C-terminal-like domain-containing protein [Caenorhabditis elegans]|eukprot:NP_496567.2 ARRestin Domain protein [Caenorhabditis elegans]